MKCPFCDNDNDKVLDSRPCKGGSAIRRRRQCLSCDRRFTTYEYIETNLLSIIKKDRRREPYNREKLIAGIRIACKKRPISSETVLSIVDSIESTLENSGKTDIESLLLGNIVMKELHKLDHIAYIRFASVYRDFKSADEFIAQISTLEETL